MMEYDGIRCDVDNGTKDNSEREEQWYQTLIVNILLG